MEPAAKDNVVGLQLLHQLAVIGQLVSGLVQESDHVLQTLVRIQIFKEFIDPGKQMLDQDAEIARLNVVFRRGCGGLGDLVGDGIGLGVLIEGDRRHPVVERVRDPIHIAGEILSQHQRPIVLSRAHSRHRLVIIRRYPVDAGSGGHFFDDLRALVAVFAALQRVTPVS